LSGGITTDKKNETYYLSCPTCRHCTELPEEGVGAFPVAFTLNNFKETLSSIKKTARSFDPQKAACNDHGKSLEFFCETCDTVICSHFSVLNHKQHEYDLITEFLYTKHCQDLGGSLEPVKRKIEALKRILSALAEREGEIRERGEGVLEEIHEMAEEMMNVLRQSERTLTEQAKRVIDLRLKVLSDQIKSAEKSLKFLENVKNYVEQSLKKDTHQQVLGSKKQMLERMSEVTAQVNVEELIPREKSDFAFIKNIESLHSISNIGNIISGADLNQFMVKKTGYYNHPPEEKKFSFSFSIKAPGSSPLSVPLSSLRCSLVPVCNHDEPTDIITTSTDPGVYRIQCSPSTSGTHTLKVQVYNVQLEDTSVAIPINPYLDNVAPVNAISKFYRPWGVAVSDTNHVIITEWKGDFVVMLDIEKMKIQYFRQSGNLFFCAPRGVAITSDKTIFLSDNHRIHLMNEVGENIAFVDMNGSKQLQFINPAGIAISPVTGQVYIADYGNHRIQVLTPNLTFSFLFGSEGSASGQFQYPCDIAIDSQGLVYVADSCNHRIQKFSSDGKFVGQFGAKGSGPGQLDTPVGITIDTAATGLVYVSEYRNNRISILTSDGVFLKYFGSEGSDIHQFKGPKGLTFDKDGFLYVCDDNNQRIVIY
uniref:B-box C-terminal domain-containing protein n=2 Tax=Amphimedon queenslandica TaxID=400682 RepID=A0A1X7U5A2_AMPQE